MKNGPTKSQMEFIAKNFIKNCEYFTRLTRKPDFMARVKQLQEKDELPMTPDSCSDPCKRVCSALVLFRFEKLPEVVLENSEDLMNNPQMKRDLDMAKVHSLLRLLHEDQIKEYSPTKETGLPAFLVPPVTGLSEMPPSQVVVSGFKVMMENLNHIVLSLRGEQPLPEEIPAELEALGFPYFNKEYWQRLCKGQGLNKESRARRKEIAKISHTKSDAVMALHLHACSWILHNFFLERIRGLMNRFALGPEWLWTLYVFLVTDVNPIHIGCIPFLNVGISDANLKDEFRLDIGKMTTSHDIQLALSMMQKVGLKSIIHNYPDKNFEENLKIEELSRQKSRVHQEIREAKEEAKEKARKEGKQFFKDENEEYLDFIHGPETDKDIATSVFPDKSEVSDELLKKEADRIKHRRSTFEKKDKKRFGPSSDSKPGK